MNENIKDLILLGIIIGFSVYLGSVISDLNNTPEISVTSEIKLTEDQLRSEGVELCRNMTVYDSAECLHRYVKTFYNYTIRTDIERTEEDIRANGGDCHDYSKLYVRLAQQLGFNADSFAFHTPTKSHRIAVIYNTEGYCILDQITALKCVMYT